MRSVAACLRSASVAGILAFVAGIVFWGGFNTAMEASNAQAFCIGCHEMKENVWPAYEKSVHFRNRAGVRATCADCHVPRPWGRMVVRKITASHELMQKLLGVADTKEKFDARRSELAQRVRRDMIASDSRECRNCHSLLYMDTSRQTAAARKHHSVDFARDTGKTCVDCHKGVGHELPSEP